MIVYKYIQWEYLFSADRNNSTMHEIYWMIKQGNLRSHLLFDLRIQVAYNGHTAFSVALY